MIVSDLEIAIASPSFASLFNNNKYDKYDPVLSVHTLTAFECVAVVYFLI